MKVLRYAGFTLGTLLALSLIALLVALWAYRDIPAEVLEEKYTNDASRFMNIDGVRVHYRDEGEGPAIVLVHAHFASLLGWEPWVDALKEDYRVIRFDMTSHGLTGPDPTGDYTVERTVELAERFIDALGLETLSIGGTSLGGTVALHYASRHPERVDKLILLSPGSLEGKEQMKKRGKPGKSAEILTYILPRAIPKYMLSSAWGETTELPEELVDRWYDMWMREDQRAAEIARLRQYEAGDLEGVAAEVRTPVLILWGEENPQAKVEQAPEFIELLSSAESVQLKIYPGVGHMAVQEAGDITGADVRAFLDGTLDLPDQKHDTFESISENEILN
ncbi:MAG: alpha/beta hydrolase [Gammaproteobacteria bacterium]|jgi:pimeloyl-ACP methyl ester carboxylesterase|nr:alpha/beta hydrolase [Gammaproteobacteria bacterium]